MNVQTARSIIVAGHSHVCALIGGITDGEVLLLPVGDRDGVFGLHGPFPRTESYWDALSLNAPDNTIALFWQGNEHNYYFLIEQLPRFDFIPRGLSSLPVADDALIVPESLVRAKLQCFSEDLHRMLTVLRQQPNCRIAVVGTPPPKEDNEHLHRLLAPEFPFVQHAAETTLEQVTLTAPTVRLKLWHVLQEIYKEQAEDEGVEYIPVPDAVTDERGYLKPQFWAHDATHANPAYGQVVLDHLIETLSRRPSRLVR